MSAGQRVVIRGAGRNRSFVRKQKGGSCRGTPRPRRCTAWEQTSIVCQIKLASCSPSWIGRLCTGTSSSAWNSSEWLPEWASLVQTAGVDARRKTLANLCYARVHRKLTVWKGRPRLVDPVGQALQGYNSHRGSSILEGPG